MKMIRDYLATGSGIATMSLRARLELARIILILIVVGALAGATVAWNCTAHTTRWLFENGLAAHLKLELVKAIPTASDRMPYLPPADQTHQFSVLTLLSDPELQNAYNFTLALLIAGSVIGGLAGGGVGWGWQTWVRSRGRLNDQDSQIRGSLLASEQALRRLTKRAAGPNPITFGSVGLPLHLESRHIAMAGSTGSGKSTALRSALDTIEDRGQPAIVYDTSGEFTAHYYNRERGDIILNPLDFRSAFWNPLDEIKVPPDADRIAGQLVPTDGPEDDQVWTEMARSVLADIMRHRISQGQTDLPGLVDAIKTTTQEQLKSALAGTASTRVFESSAERATASVLFNLTKPSRILQFLRSAPGPGGSFSFTSYFQKIDHPSAHKPWIFIQRQEQHFEATRGLIGAWLECAASAILSLPPSDDRAIWLILDEFPELPRVANIERMLPLGRKHGARVILTLQSVGQLNDRYGREAAGALLGQCSTKLFLQLADSETRKWASQTIGEAELELRSQSSSLSFDSRQSRTSVTAQRQVRPLILESEFRLPPHRGYLVMPDGLPIARISLNRDHIDRRGPPKEIGFEPADINDTLWSASRSKPTEDVANLSDHGPV